MRLGWILGVSDIGGDFSTSGWIWQDGWYNRGEKGKRRLVAMAAVSKTAGCKPSQVRVLSLPLGEGAEKLHFLINDGL